MLSWSLELRSDGDFQGPVRSCHCLQDVLSGKVAGFFWEKISGGIERTTSSQPFSVEQTAAKWGQGMTCSIPKRSQRNFTQAGAHQDATARF